MSSRFPRSRSADLCHFSDEDEVLEEDAGQPIAPASQGELDAAAQAEVLTEELKALRAGEDAIAWEPTCPNQNRDFADDAACLSSFFQTLNFDDDFIEPLLCEPRKTGADKVILPAFNASCNYLKSELDFYLERGLSDPAAGTKGLVFYRRHSIQLKPHLTSSSIEFYESMCNFLASILHNAGYSMTGMIASNNARQ